jgi:hypothetical protein
MQNNFSISNTDLVTMLMVKQKEILNKRLAELRVLVATDIAQAYKRAKKKFDPKFKEVKPLLDKYEELIKVFNPKVKFEIRVWEFDEHDLQIRNEKNIFFYFVDYDYIYFEVDVDEKHEGKYVSIEPGNGFFVPFKFSFKETLSEEILDIKAEMLNIENLLYNDSKLRDVIVAKMTETALQNMPELKMLSENALIDLKLLS